MQQQMWKQQAAEAAAELIEDGMVIGIGTGTTAAFLIQAIARRMQAGLQIKAAISTSQASARLAQSLNIPLSTLEAYPEIDLDIDGADEIDEHLYLIKGGGGALLREKIVASASRQFIIIADATKQVTRLGTHFPLPIEVVPFALPTVRHRLKELGAQVEQRMAGENAFITDNANIILDCRFPEGIADPQALQETLCHIVGIVETGLFLNLATGAVIAGPAGVQHFQAPASSARRL